MGVNAQVLNGILLPFWGTSLGAGCVFLLAGGFRPAAVRALSGFSAGIMTAASFFSLLLPALAQAAPLGPFAFLPASVGVGAGMGFVPLTDALRTRRRKGRAGMQKTAKLILAVTLHNLPEGMAVGAIYAGWRSGAGEVGLAAAWALALGIALQNLPEGAIVSLPLRASGQSRGRAFAMGVLSGAVEPLGAGAVLLAAGALTAAMPYLLSFAAGAMLYVVIVELLPDLNGRTAWFILGFLLMMALDVGLG